MEVVEPIEDRHLARRQNSRQRKRPPVFEHAKGLGERAIDVRHVADAEGDRVGVERVVGKGQRLGVALREGDAALEMRRAHAAAPDADHLRADVAQHGGGIGAAGARVADRDVARAAGDVERAGTAARRAAD